MNGESLAQNALSRICAMEIETTNHIVGSPSIYKSKRLTKLSHRVFAEQWNTTYANVKRAMYNSWNVGIINATNNRNG